MCVPMVAGLLPAYLRPLPQGNNVTHLTGNRRDLQIRVGTMDPFQAAPDYSLRDIARMLKTHAERVYVEGSGWKMIRGSRANTLGEAA